MKSVPPQCASSDVTTHPPPPVLMFKPGVLEVISRSAWLTVQPPVG